MAIDLPAKDPTSCADSNAEVGTSALEQGPPVAEPSLLTASPQNNTALGLLTDANVSENDSSVGDSRTVMPSQPTAAGTDTGVSELMAASSALLAVTRDVSSVHNQVPYLGVAVKLAACMLYSMFCLDG